jgi:hypothetical protein
MLSMAAQGFNSSGAAQKLKEVFKIMLKHEPVNIADDGQGGVLSGRTVEEILAAAGDGAYMGAVYDDARKVRDTLADLKGADLGMSVIVSGEFEEVFKLLKEVGLKPNSVHLSLGIFGKTELLPDPKVLEITCMCGHGMVTPDLVRNTVARVARGRLTPEQAAIALARPCTCGIFNPATAADIIADMCAKSTKGRQRREN